MWCAETGKHGHEWKVSNMRTIALFASISIVRTDVCKCLHLIGSRKLMGSEIPGSIAPAREYFKRTVTIGGGPTFGLGLSVSGWVGKRWNRNDWL